MKKEEEAKKPPPPFLNPDSKPTVSTTEVYGDEFETSSSKPTVSSGDVGPSSTGAAASGAVTFENPEPLTEQEAVNRRSE